MTDLHKKLFKNNFPIHFAYSCYVLSVADVNGSVLHVVQRAPPSARGTPSTSSGSTSSQGYMQGAFSMNHEMREAGQVQVCNVVALCLIFVLHQYVVWLF